MPRGAACGWPAALPATRSGREGTPYPVLGAGAARRRTHAIAELLGAMVTDPILINRPFVVTPLGVTLARPSEKVLDILPLPQKGAFAKEDGEQVIDAAGNRIG